MHEVGRVIMVKIKGDREKTLAFQEWALNNRLITVDAPSTCSGDSLIYFFDVQHEERIKEWFANLENETTACDLCGASHFVSPMTKRCYSEFVCEQRRGRKGYDLG